MTSQRPLCLIVDRDAAHARSLAQYCDERGFEARCLAEEEVASLLADSANASDTTAGGSRVAADAAFIDASLGVSMLEALADGPLAEADLFAMAEDDDTALAEACVRAGYSFFFRKPFDPKGLAALLEDIVAEAIAEQVPDTAAADDASLAQFGLLRGASRGMRKLYRLLRKVGPTDTSVLIVGESGTGKELVAETLHRMSARSGGPYLTVNCAAITENLIESELFGHEKGSFSGAQTRHLGFFERASGGTLFLDEITEMTADVQAKLLRALESGEIRRVGGARALSVDVRIIAATNREPRDAVAEGALREDLYYRLAHVTAVVPPLRDRGADIAGLAHYFLRQLNERHDTALRFSSQALAAIEERSWPGNVRELRHAVERAYIMAEEEIGAEAFAAGQEGDMPGPADISLPLGLSLAECERRIILANLEHLGGDKKETAALLGISLKTLYNRLRDYRADDEED
jgi:DNA-binding NtrC family response regulator